MRRSFLFLSALLIMMSGSSVFSQAALEIILPKFIEGIFPTNNNRLPFVYRLRLTGLTPNATYRYYNTVVSSTDGATSNGAGNCIFVNPTGDFTRTSSVSLSTPGGYSTFTTNDSGIYEGWFITEPTGNARFAPGRHLRMRIILNDGAGGTTVATRITTTDSVRVVSLRTVSADSCGTGLYAQSSMTPKNFIFAYDNVNGTGRPISGTFIESDGTSGGTTYSAFYGNFVDQIDGAFGMVLPNILPNGIRRFEQRALAGGHIVSAYTDDDGIWPSGANTVNPSGGTDPIVIMPEDLNNPPTAFNLLSPPDSFTWVVSPISTEELFFSWQHSIDPEGMPVYYTVEHDTSPLFDSPLFSSDYVDTDTSFILYASDIAMSLINMGFDSITYFWRVSATDDIADPIYSNQTFRATFKLAPNQPPTAFNLLDPPNDFRWVAALRSNENLGFRWQSSFDPDGGPITYYFCYDTVPTFDSPLSDMMYVGTDTTFEVSSFEVTNFLTQLNADSINLFWRIKAEDDFLYPTYSQQSWKIKLVKAPGNPYCAMLKSHEMVPPSIDYSKFGFGFFDLNVDSTDLYYNITFITFTEEGGTANIHNALAGSNGPILFSLPITNYNTTGTIPITLSIARELAAGKLYVQHPDFGIRGQIQKGLEPAYLPSAEDLLAIELQNSILLTWKMPQNMMNKTQNHFALKSIPVSRAKEKHIHQNKQSFHETRPPVASKKSLFRNKVADLLDKQTNRTKTQENSDGSFFGFNIYRSEDGGTTYAAIAQTTSLSYVDNNVVPGINYSYLISALYLEGQAYPSNMVYADPAMYYTFMENFNDTNLIAAGALPMGWIKIDADGGDEDTFWGEWRMLGALNPAFTPLEGSGMAAITYMAANPLGQIDEWLITPRLIANTASRRLNFFARAISTEFPDSLQILLSKTGLSPSSFYPIDYFQVPESWTQFQYDLSHYALSPGDSFYVAFRYLIHDGGSYGNNSYLPMLDLVRIDGQLASIGINDPVAGIPKQFELYANYPNPFNPATSIKYDLRENAKVTLKIYNSLGQEVRTLVNARQNAGQYTIQWDGKNNAGSAVSSGVYIYRIKAGDFIKSKKMLLLK